MKKSWIIFFSCPLFFYNQYLFSLTDLSQSNQPQIKPLEDNKIIGCEVDDNIGIITAEKSRHALTSARALVEKKQYSEALVYYYQLLKLNEFDTDLLIEIARVFGWGDKNAQSAACYRKIIKIDPEKRKEVLQPLAWQSLWSNQTKQAIDYFKEYLNSNPNDKEAQKGLYESQLQEARLLVKNKQYREALELYNALLKKPLTSDLMIETARVYGWADKNKEAADLYEKVLKLFPIRKYQILKSLAWQTLWSKQAKQAEEYFKDYLAAFPGDKDAQKGVYESRLEEARLLTKYNKKKEALLLFNTLLRQYPQNPDLMIETARAYAWFDYNKESESLYEKILKLYPAKKYQILKPLAWQSLWSNHSKRAIEYFKEYLASYKNDKDAQKGLYESKLQEARLLVKTNKNHEALVIYNTLLKQNPQNSDLMIETAKVYGWVDENKESANLYEKVLRWFPLRKYQILKPLAWQSLWSKQVKQAIAYFKEYLASYPEDKDAKKGLFDSRLVEIQLLLKNKEKHKALLLFDTLLKQDPQNSELMIEKAKIYGWLNKNKESADLYEKILKLFPAKKYEILKPLAWQKLWSKQVKQAKVYFNEYLASYPDDKDAKKGLYESELEEARLLWKNNEKQKAFLLFNTLLKQNPQNSDLMIEMARVFGWIDKNKESADLYEKILKLFPAKKYEILRPLAWQSLWSKQVKQAKVYFKEYLASYPNDKDAKKGLYESELEEARLLWKNNEKQKALLLFNTLLKQNPQNSDLMIETARVFGWIDKNKESADLYEKVLKWFPVKKYQILKPLAWQSLWSKQVKQARIYFKEYLASYPDDKDAKIGLYESNLEEARLLWKNNEKQKALLLFSALLKQNPLNSDLMIETARVFGWADKNKESACLYEKILRLFPARKYDILKALAWQTLWSNYPLKAIGYFKNYLLKYPNDADAKKGYTNSELEYARVLAKNKEYEKSLCYFYKLMAQDPKNINLIIETANVNGWADNHEQAVCLYEQVIQQAPQRTKDVLKSLGWQVLWMKDAERAKQLFLIYLERFPLDKEAILGYANAIENQHNWMAALNLYKWLIRENYKYIEARYAKARIHLGLNELIKAEREYCTILSIKPNDWDATMGIIRAHNLGGLNRQAVAEYNQLCFKGHENEYFEQLATAQYWSGFPELALDTLEQIPEDRAIYLRKQVLRDLNAYFLFNNDNSVDSDDLRINAPKFTIGVPYNERITFEPAYRFINIREPNPNDGDNFESIQGNMLYGTLINRMGTLCSPWGTNWSRSMIGFRSYDHWHTIAWGFQDKWVVRDWARILIFSGNEVIENVLSINNRIVFNSGSAELVLQPHPRIVLTDGGGMGVFNENNIRRRWVSRLEGKLIDSPHLTIISGYDAFGFTDSKPEIYVGYYNPASYWEKKVIGVTKIYIDNFTFIGRGGWGYFGESPGAGGKAYNYELAIEKNFPGVGYIRGFFGESKSAPGLSSPTATAKGYRREYWGITAFLTLY